MKMNEREVNGGLKIINGKRVIVMVVISVDSMMVG